MAQWRVCFRSGSPVSTPAFPAFNQSIVDALALWEYMPLQLEGKARPFCATVAVTIDF